MLRQRIDGHAQAVEAGLEEEGEGEEADAHGHGEG